MPELYLCYTKDYTTMVPHLKDTWTGEFQRYGTSIGRDLEQYYQLAIGPVFMLCNSMKLWNIWLKVYSEFIKAYLSNTIFTVQKQDQISYLQRVGFLNCNAFSSQGERATAERPIINSNPTAHNFVLKFVQLFKQSSLLNVGLMDRTLTSSINIKKSIEDLFLIALPESHDDRVEGVYPRDTMTL